MRVLVLTLFLVTCAPETNSDDDYTTWPQWEESCERQPDSLRCQQP